MAVLPPIPDDVGELHELEKAMVLRATASKAIPWRVERRTASGDLVLAATIPAAGRAMTVITTVPMDGTGMGGEAATAMVAESVTIAATVGTMRHSKSSRMLRVNGIGLVTADGPEAKASGHADKTAVVTPGDGGVFASQWATRQQFANPLPYNPEGKTAAIL